MEAHVNMYFARKEIFGYIENGDWKMLLEAFSHTILPKPLPYTDTYRRVLTITFPFFE